MTRSVGGSLAVRYQAPGVKAQEVLEATAERC